VKEQDRTTVVRNTEIRDEIRGERNSGVKGEKKEKGRGKAGRARNGTPLLGKAPHWVATVNHLQVDY
jgi:hypothetical protein